MFSALRERQFRLLFIGQSLSLLGSAVTTIALAFAVYSIGGSNFDVGIVMAAALVPVVLFLLVGGVWSDRLPRQWVMMIADLVRFVCQVIMAALLITHVATVWELAALQFLRGTAEAFFRPALTGVVPLTVSQENLQQGNALRGMTESIGVTIGAAFGGVLVAAVGPGWAIGLDGLTYLASAGFLWGLRGLEQGPSSRGEDFLDELREGWREFVSRTWLWVMVALAAFFHLLMMAPLMVLGPRVANEELGGAVAWGAIMAALGAGEILGGIVGLRLKPARPLLFCGWLALIEAPLFAFFALGLGTPALVGAALFAGVSAALMNVLWETTLQEQVPGESLSRVSAFDWTGSMAFYPLGLVLAGPLAAVLGIQGAFALATFVALASAAAEIALPDIRRVRRRRAHAPELVVQEG